MLIKLGRYELPTGLLLSLSMVLIVVAGCGPGAPEGRFEDHTGDAARYAQRMKEMVINEMTSALKERDEEAVYEHARSVFLELELYHQQPVGEHGAVYAELLEGAEQLVQHLDSGGSPDQARTMMEQQIATAEQLPGDVVIHDEPDGD